MREWIVKFSAVDDEAAATLRVIEHFDSLVDLGASALAMLRAAASLAECNVGIDDRTRHLRIGLDARGRVLPDDERENATATRQVEISEHVTVWLDRHGPTGPLDHLILERLSRSVQGVREWRASEPDVPALEVVCNSGATDAARADALGRLGLQPDSPVRVTVTGIADAHESDSAFTVDDVQVHVRPRTAQQSLPSAIAAGTIDCMGHDIHRAWRRARTALRVAVDPATGAPSHVDCAVLGSIATVIDAIDARTAAKVEDVQALVELNTRRPWVVPTLDAVLGYHSTREVARQLELHHSTVQQRVVWMEEQLGYALFSGSGRARAAITLVLWRIVIADAHTAVPRPHLRDSSRP